MKLQEQAIYSGFRLERSVFVKELNSQAYEMVHVRSGARLLYLANDDDNKVFSISFRTPPQDSTGVAHICEHSVLCGSRKFPLKEPFVELVKGSLNTFLNAMTFPDKTMYPVASRNAVDFKNLMDVYLDAVFFPNMLTDEEVLMQEGWHYDLESPEAPLTYRGVVYNEMKGVFSSPDSQMERHVMENLFPHTTYGVESGGDPDCIPQLTQEAFAAFHQKYYHPSNSYIFLYGDLDIEQTLAFIDAEYLSKFTVIPVDSMIGRQAFPGGTIVQTYPYGIASDEKTDHKAMHTLTYVMDDALDPTLAMALKVLTYVLLQSPAAPLKKALVDAGLGKEISGDFQDGILQPLWSISLNGSDPEAQGKILPVVRSFLEDMVRHGIDKTLLTGALNRTEFSLREADFAGRPKGLIYGIRCMDSWLYDGDPLTVLMYEDALKELRQGMNSSYYEDIIRKYILDNPYYALITLVPEKGLTETKEKQLADQLAKFKQSLSSEEVSRIVDKSNALKKRQAEPDSPEALLTIPTLTKDDLDHKAEEIELIEEEHRGVKVCYVPDFANGVTYVNAYFNLLGLTTEEVPYAFLLSDLLGDLDTKKRTYGELASQIDLYTGGIDYSIGAHSELADNSRYVPLFKIRAKVLRQNIDHLLQLLREISTETIFSNESRLHELIHEIKSGWDMDVFRRGLFIVQHRLLSYVSPVENFCDAGEFSYYEFISRIARSLETELPDIMAKLEQVMAKIFTQANLTLEVTGEEQDKNAVVAMLGQWLDAMPIGRLGQDLFAFPVEKKNEGILTSGKVQYVAKGGNFYTHGFTYTGSLSVLDTILQYGYLWTKIRVQGGAYGAFTRFYQNGDMLFCSYRDPNLRNSLQAYDDLADYLATFDVSEREMTKYVIGTLSRVDIPITPSTRGIRAMGRYFSGLTQEIVQQNRDQLINTTVADIRAMAPMIKAVMADNNICVMGSEQEIRKEQALFDHLVSLPD